MKKSGSITVFTSLFLAVFLLVFQVLLQSVQIGGGRVQAETGVEEGLYSVFAGYDRELLERYHVFMVDGSCCGNPVWISDIQETARDGENWTFKNFLHSKQTWHQKQKVQGFKQL